MKKQSQSALPSSIRFFSTAFHLFLLLLPVVEAGVLEDAEKIPPCTPSASNAHLLGIQYASQKTQ